MLSGDRSNEMNKWQEHEETDGKSFVFPLWYVTTVEVKTRLIKLWFFSTVEQYTYYINKN